MTRSIALRWVWGIVLFAGIASAEPPTSAPAPTSQPATSDPDVKPRLELHIPSLKSLLSQARASHSGVWVRQAARMLDEMGGTSSEGVDLEELAAIVRQIREWPDTSIRAATYAADTEGRLRWAIKLDWPLHDLHARVAPVVSSEATATLLEGVTLKKRDGTGFEIKLHDATLAYLLASEGGRSCIASHPDLELIEDSRHAPFESADDGRSLVNCRLNLTATEKDSGATILSSFRAVTDVVYESRVSESGDWLETVDVHWPPISGMGAKVFLSKVKQTFFVPEEAFGGLVVNSLTGPGLLVNALGLGPQLVIEEGQMSVLGDANDLGPIVSALGSETCLAILPGTGVLPTPDIIVQTRVKRPEKLIEAVRSATKKINESHQERDQKPPWREVSVRDRAVFWSDGAQFPGMVMMPVIMRPVLFVTRETIGEEKERDFLVAAWTSTSPEGLVRRWLDLPRHEKRRDLPSEKKTDGQMWIHWQLLYKWLSPYANLTLSVVLRDALLPRAKEIAAHLTDAWLTIKVGYAGINLDHRGPMPIGILVVPTLLELSLSMDAGGSDLARERVASQRLKVLFHHCKLFKKDLGRWPAEVAELDGYVDFEGHPELLQLDLSSRKMWSEWFKEAFEPSEKKAAEDDEAEAGAIDTKRFVIEWSRDAWRLGYAPGTFEHLEKLYIDQNGAIHRLERK